MEKCQFNLGTSKHFPSVTLCHPNHLLQYFFFSFVMLIKCDSLHSNWICAACWWCHMLCTGPHRTEEPGEKTDQVGTNLLHIFLLPSVFTCRWFERFVETFRFTSGTGWKESAEILVPEAHLVHQALPLCLDSLDSQGCQGEKDRRCVSQREKDHVCVFKLWADNIYY